MANRDAEETKLQGIAASPGICIGRAYLVDQEGVDVVSKYSVMESNLRDEIKRFKTAVKNAKDELRSIIENTPEELHPHANILETHLVLFEDKMLYDRTIETIEKEKVNAEWAFKKVVSGVKSMFQNIKNSYLKERAEDIIHVSQRIMRKLVGVEAVNIGDIDKRVILVAHDLSPADASQIKTDKIMGLVTERGGRASHTGIIARALEIPAVMGLDHATKLIKNDDLIIVDGSTGIVITRPAEQTLADYGGRQIRYREYQTAVSRDSHLLAETTDGFIVPVMGNIELSDEAASVVEHGGDGIGLYRTEFQYLSGARFPKESELFEKYKRVVEMMAPKPVTIRTLDINGDKAVNGFFDDAENNPALGLRAIRYCLKNPDVFKTQLRAILRAAVFGNVRIMFPMISSCEEVREAKRLLNEAADSLAEEGETFRRDIKIGIMVEVPSAVVMADLLAEEVDFFSIGTNDLIQYLLAIDRDNTDVSHLFQPLNPAIIRMMKHVCDVGGEKGVQVFMCGEMAGEPLYIPLLLGLGINELSMNPQSIPAVKSTIRVLSAKDAGRFAEDVLRRPSASEVMKLLRNEYGDILSDKVYTE